MRLKGEHVVLVSGLALVTLAGLQAYRGASFEFLLLGGIALVALGLFRHQLRSFKFGPSGIDMAIEEAASGMEIGDPSAKQVRDQLDAPSQPNDIKLLISTGIPVGAAEAIMGTDHFIQVTAVNTTDRPIGVNSIGVSLTDGRWAPFIDAVPTTGNRALPAILSPQETTSAWVDHEAFRERLHSEGVHIKAIVAHLADGSRREQPVPDDWAQLG